MKQTTKLTLFALIVGFTLAGASAHARAHHRSRGGGGSGRAHHRGGGYSGGMHPEASITSGQCDIQVDCQHYKMSINGENVGQIICGKQTGKGFAHKKVKLLTSIHASTGKYMARGFPMIPTSPELCSGCYFHAYPHVGPTSHSLGCVGITMEAWNKLRRCGGSDIAFNTMDGRVQSDMPKTMYANNAPKTPATSPAAQIGSYQPIDEGDPLTAPIINTESAK